MAEKLNSVRYAWSFDCNPV